MSATESALDIIELAELAKDQLSKVTGLKPVTITGVFRDEQGWHVLLDMLEMVRIPTATDLLGEYEVVADNYGHMFRFERKSTRLRGEPQGRE